MNELIVALSVYSFVVTIISFIYCHALDATNKRYESLLERHYKTMNAHFDLISECSKLKNTVESLKRPRDERGRFIKRGD